MSKTMIVLATALALSAMSTEVIARGGGGGGGGSKSGQTSSATTSAARSVSSGTATGKRMHKPITFTTQSGRASPSLLRGNNANDNGKGGRYLAGYAKKVPCTRKTSTVTLKRGMTPEKVEAGSENIRRVKP